MHLIYGLAQGNARAAERLYHERYSHREVAESLTATAGSDVVQSGRPIFDDFFNICDRISAITWRMLSSK
ncbi:hypothetical protein TNCV_782591 [Trichonephila clavipes]|nr:hypothetical protein TNCV_782591 [Trichonephila clavipes]